MFAKNNTSLTIKYRKFMSNTFKTMILGSLAAVTMLAASCSGEKKDPMDGNPFKEPSTLAYHVPDYSKIQNEHYLPAFKEGIKEKRAEIEAIVNNEEAPTFENTILPYEDSGALLSRVSSAFFTVSGADGTDEIKEIENEVIPLLTALSDEISFNDKLFDRIKVVYDNEFETLQGEDKKLLDEIYKGFVRSGANLDSDKKAELEKINARLAVLQQQFVQMNIDARNKAMVAVEDVNDLAGLSEAAINQCAADAKEAGIAAPYAIVISNTTQQGILSSLDNRALREKVYNASINRSNGTGEINTYPVILEIAQLRHKKANIMGFPNYASYSLSNTMAQTPENVWSFFEDLIKAYRPAADKETAEIEAYAQKTEGSDFKLQPYDRFYYSDKMKQEKYNFSSEDVMPYLQAEKVLEDGVFYAAGKVYGLTFKERFDIPTYHPDVRVYDIFDKDGSQISMIYIDLFRRPTKGGGAWMGEFHSQSRRNNQLPIIYNVCNFVKAPEGQPNLLTWDEVTTMFHEFGHALHGLLSNVEYETLSGTNVTRDFVEMPSQFNEYFASVPEVFNNFAVHYETGEPMPEDLKSKMLESINYHAAYALGENLASSSADLAFHSLESADDLTADNIANFENEALSKLNLLDPQIPPRYMTSYFNHIWGGGYAAGYYSYLWSEVLAVNVGEYFTAHGSLNPEVGDSLREKILSRGNTKDLGECFSEFTGLEKPNAASLLPARGIK